MATRATRAGRIIPNCQSSAGVDTDWTFEDAPAAGVVPPASGQPQVYLRRPDWPVRDRADPSLSRLTRRRQRARPGTTGRRTTSADERRSPRALSGWPTTRPTGSPTIPPPSSSRPAVGARSVVVRTELYSVHDKIMSFSALNRSARPHPCRRFALTLTGANGGGDDVEYHHGHRCGLERQQHDEQVHDSPASRVFQRPQVIAPSTQRVRRSRRSGQR